MYLSALPLCTACCVLQGKLLFILQPHSVQPDNSFSAIFARMILRIVLLAIIYLLYIGIRYLVRSLRKYRDNAGSHYKSNRFKS